MTPDRIDLDDMDVEDDADPTEAPNRGDWFWRGVGDPDAEPDDAEAWASARGSADGAPTAGERDGGGADGGPGADGEGDPDGVANGEAGANDGAEAADAGSAPADYRPAPRVPSQTDGAPVGIPIRQGGAGGGSSGDGGEGDEQGDGQDAPAGADGNDAREAGDGSVAREGAADTSTRTGDGSSAPSGPHGGGPDDMTLAFTYDAITRLADPRGAVADAEGWTDWIGIVGEVGAPAINKFQREHRVDADFFNGSGTGPGERLAEIDARSMFYADRMVVVGVAGEDESVAEAAGWEFVPLAEAAGEAGWVLRE